MMLKQHKAWQNLDKLIYLAKQIKIIMKTKILIFSIYTLLSSINFGQVTGKVNGKVTDRITKESLPGVNVVVLGTECREVCCHA